MATEAPTPPTAKGNENETSPVEEGLGSLSLDDHADEDVQPLGLNDYTGEAAVESPALSGHEESFPANTSTLPTDYSDVPSNKSDDSGKQKQRRKYQRGGRKRGSQSNLAEEAEGDGGAEGVEPRVKSAESSGGRPFGMSVEGQDKRVRSKSKPKLKHKAKSKRRKQKQKEQEQEEEKKENWESETSSEEESESESESEEEKDEKGKKKKNNKKEKKEEKKPLSIRFDLNIELEIFLKAKIKGDITVTFL
ncbi:hypothetical protein LSUB1_G007655 [Lachnellula subtilissima]|uniref:Uncharacterized protein n=1 Tax=Lachnellula subtilissima TaxID=602034 RepID=A0A8H8REK0_9HELO|nr:hypothetical protein LSUB1_G007655 [Lachnellula subtilissima]